MSLDALKSHNGLQIFESKQEPIGSMYGIFSYIWLIFMVNVCNYTSPMDPMGNAQQVAKGCYFLENLMS